MYRYDDYVNLINDLELPKEIRNKCVRVIVHKFKTYVVNEKYIGKVA